MCIPNMKSVSFIDQMILATLKFANRCADRQTDRQMKTPKQYTKKNVSLVLGA